MFRQKALQNRNRKELSKKEEREKNRLKDKNRKRKYTVAFRVTEVERDLIDERVKLSGRLKQEYLLEASLNHDVTFVGDRQVFNTMKDNLNRIEKRLKDINLLEEIEVKDMYILKTIIEMLENSNNKQ